MLLLVFFANQLSGLTTTDTSAPPLTGITVAADGLPRTTAADNDPSMIVTPISVTPVAIDAKATSILAGTEPDRDDAQVSVTAMVQQAEPLPTATETQEDSVLLAAVAEMGASPPSAPASAAV